MLNFPKSVLAAGGIVLTAGALMLTNPRAVHAVAAALVQVTNTASNPVVTQGVGQQAATLIHLTCSQGLTGSDGAGACAIFKVSNGSNESVPFLVPANQSFVITSVDIFPAQIFQSTTCNVIHEDRLAVTANYSTKEIQTWVADNTSLHYSYPSGIVVGTGSQVSAESAYPLSYSGPCINSYAYIDPIDLYGYLTAN
jgi:hypothetical protein